MNIVQVCKYFYPKVTGVTSYVHSLSAALARRGHRVTVLTWGDADEEQQMDGFRLIRVGGRSREGLAAALAQLSGEGVADVVNTHGIWEHVPVVSGWCRKNMVPHVVTMHGTWMFLHTTDAYATLRGRLWYGLLYKKILWPRIMRRAAAAIVLNAQEEDMARHWALVQNCIHRIPNAVDTAMFTPALLSPEITGEASSVSENKRLQVVFAGALQSQKGLFTVLRAAERLNAAGTPVHWTICGRGPEEARARQIIADCGLENCVLLAGAVPRECMPQTYRDAGVVVLPSYGEPFGTVYLEAMASGVPCIGCRSGGTPEIICDGETGYLIEYDDEQALAERVSALAADVALRRRMGEAGRKRAEALFAWETVTSHLEDVYAQVSR